MITYIIIAVTAFISIMAFSNRSLFDKLLFDPYRIQHMNQYYRFISHGFVHADWMHLLINMFVLLSFGRMVENAFLVLSGVSKGIYYFILLYIGALLFSSVPAFGKHKNNTWYTAVGASGAVSAVLFSSILISPLSGIRFIFIPFNIPAFIFAILYLVYSAYMAKKSQDNIGHDAHFWGAVFGFVFTIVIKPSLFLGFIHQISNFTL
jgi:membrane associated rhomboid family serine protease